MEAKKDLKKTNIKTKDTFVRIKEKTSGYFQSSRARLSINSLGNVSRNIIIAVTAFVIICAAAALIYYYFFYLQPNFDDANHNLITSFTASEIEPGSEIIYDIYYKNDGMRAVDELKAIVSIPQYTSFLDSKSDYILDEEDSTITFTVNDIEVNTSGLLSFTVKADYPLDNGTRIIVDDAIFIYTINNTEYDQALESSVSHTIKSSPVFDDIDINTSDTSGGYLYMGDELTYTVKIKNEGKMNATGFKLKAAIPDSVELLENSINEGGKYDNGSIIWDTGIFEADKTIIYKFRVEVNQGLNDGDIIESVFTLSCDQNISMEESTRDEIRAFPDLSGSEVFISDANGGSLWAGETVDVQVIIRNTGQKTADTYTLSCPIPDGATYISKSGTAEGISWSDDIRGLIWELEGLEPGDEQTISFKMKVNDNLYYSGGTITTDFQLESEGEEFKPEARSLSVSRHIYMTIVAMGDSLIARSDWVQRLDNLLESTYPIADYNTIASGINGEIASHGYYRFDSTIGTYKPQIVIIAYGTNDAGTGLGNFRIHLEGIVNKARNLGATVFLNTVGPVSFPGKESWPLYNQVVLEVAAKYSLPVIDVTTPLSQNKGKYLSDGTHYSPDGSAVVAQTAFNVITQYLNSSGGRR